MTEIVPLRPGLWLVETHLEEFDVRGAVLAGGVRAVVWDTLARPSDMEGVEALISDLPFTVVYSHGDWDHVWGTGGLPPRWEGIVAHEDCGSRFRNEVPGVLAEKIVSEPDLYGTVILFPPTRTFRRRLSLELGGATLELHSLPGHTPDTIVGYIPQWNILLGGDAVEDPLPFLSAPSGVRGWVQELEGWARILEEGGGQPDNRPGRAASPEEGDASKAPLEGDLPPPLVIPSHGPLGGPQLLRANAQYLRDLAAGREPSLPRELPRFYRETHATNRALARGEGDV